MEDVKACGQEKISWPAALRRPGYLKLSRVRALYLYGVVLYAAIALAIIFSYTDIKDIARAGNQFIIDGKVKLYWGLFFGPVFLMATFPAFLGALRRVRALNGLEAAIMLWFAGGIISLAVGLLNHNDKRYLLGDAFILSIIPFSYFFVVRNVEGAKEAIRLFYFLTAVSFVLFCVPVTWGTPSQRDGYTVIGLYTLSGTEAMVTVSLMVLAIFRRDKWLYISLLVIAISASLIRTRMTYIIQVLSILPVVFFVHRRCKGFIRSYLLILAVTVFSIFALINSGIIPDPPSYQRTGYFLRATYNNAHIKTNEWILDWKQRRANRPAAATPPAAAPSSDVISAAPDEPEKKAAPEKKMVEMPTFERLYEMKVVVDKFKERPWASLLGFGNGATIELTDTPDETMRLVYGGRVDKVHSIHLLPFAIFFRQGILGASLFLALCLSMAAYFYKMKDFFRTTSEGAIVIEILFLNIFVMLVGSLTASPHFFISLTAGFSLGLIGVLMKDAGSSGLTGYGRKRPDCA